MAWAVFAVLVTKRTFENEDLFTQGMSMGRKTRARIIPHQTGSMTLLCLLSSQRDSTDAGHGAGLPWLALGVDNDPLAKLHIEHIANPAW